MSESFNWKKVITDKETEADAAQPTPPPVLDQAPQDVPVLVVEDSTSTAPGAEQAQAEEGRDMTYRPEGLPTNVHDIKVGPKKYGAGLESIPILHAGVDGNPMVENFHLDEILRMAFERKASDIHLTVGLPPMVRLDGELMPLSFQPLVPQDTRRLIFETLTDENVHKLEKTHELDFGYGVKDVGRFRFNVYMQRGSYAGALRSIPTKIPSYDELSLPPIVRDVSKRSSGLILVTGPTGSGKSTTIASMIDDINTNNTTHIMTIEDPIEYLHTHKKSMVNQREMHADTFSFHAALRAVLREDPDIILVGELRDLETIEAALTLAETGHLVFGTLHTRNAPATIDRIVDVFPPDQQAQIRVLLGNTLEGVISQQLLPRLGGGRRAALEVMLGTPAIKNLIREGKTHQMYSVIETSSNVGMQTMDRNLSDLFKNGYVAYEECLMRAVDKDNYSRLAKAA
ncbi:MAG TPA: type IV pilus twitching motility protein PilT [Fimbriimonadaceae bacterium]|jgi:twitching motility protein PilT